MYKFFLSGINDSIIGSKKRSEFYCRKESHDFLRQSECIVRIVHNGSSVDHLQRILLIFLVFACLKTCPFSLTGFLELRTSWRTI